MSPEELGVVAAIGACMVGLAGMIWAKAKPKPRRVRVERSRNRAGGRHEKYGDNKHKTLP